MATARMRRNQKFKWHGETYELICLAGKHWQVKNLDKDEIIFILTTDLLRAYTEGDLEYLAGDTQHSKLIPINTNRDADTIANLPSPVSRNLMALRVVLEGVLHNIGYTGSTSRIADYINRRDIKLEVDGILKKPHPYFIYRHLKQYVQSEKELTSLLPKAKSRGNREDRIDPKLVELGEAALDDQYLTLNRNTKQSTLKAFINGVTTENNQRNPRDHLPIPTLSTLNSILKRIPREDVQRARYGADVVRHDNRTSVKGAVASEPNERWEIDHTLANWILVDDRTGLPIGRPWLTLVIDRYTRCIMGYHLTFDPPGYSSVAAALRMAIMPKHYLNEKYKKLRGVWEQHGTPEFLGVDNGLEFHCVSLEKACAFWNINLQYCPRLTPWFKGAVERGLGTLNRQIGDIIPGGKTFDNVSQLKGNNPKKFARMSLSMANEVIVRWIVDIYHANKHRGINCSPSQMWQANVDPQDLKLPINPDQLSLITGVVDYRRVWHYGVEINNATYNSKELGLFRQSLKKGEKALVRYNPQDLGSIFVEIGGHNLKVPVDPKRSYMCGMSLYVHKIIRAKLVEMDEDPNDAVLQAEIQEELRQDMHDAGQQMKAITVRMHRAMKGIGNRKTDASSAPATKQPKANKSIEQRPGSSVMPLEIPEFSGFTKDSPFPLGV